ncbi:hypothetical protein [Enterococcus saccharolyticus]
MQNVFIILFSVVISTVINVFLVRKTSEKILPEVEKTIDKYKKFIEKRLE